MNDMTPKIDNPRTNYLLIPAPPLARSRYNRQLLLPQLSLPGQHRLLASSILIIGLGGLGCPAALYLAGAGISRLGLVDADTVETSNLHRQILHTETAAGKGMSKVASAIHACKERNSEVQYIPHEERLSTENALGILGEYDVVLDCTDNPATRYLVSDACAVLGKVLVSGAAQRVEGQLMVLNYPVRSEASLQAAELVETGKGKGNGEEREQEMKVLERGPCYRCVFPRPPAPEMVRGCNEIGILGPVVGCIGTLMASEAIRLIVRGAHLGFVDETQKPSMLLYNAWPGDAKNMFRTVMMAGRRKGCVACGEEDVLGKLGKRKITREVFEEGGVDYVSWCGRVEDVRVLKEGERMKATEFLSRMESKEGRVVDVREENEFALGTKVKGSVNVPLSRIMRDPVEAFGTILQEDAQAQDTKPTYFVCHQGNDSQIAARKLMQLDEKERRRRGWIGDVHGGFLALEQVQLDSS